MAPVLDENGLAIETEAEIETRLRATVKATFGVNTAVNASSIMGQLINIFAEAEALVQQTLLGVYRSQDPNGAFGAALDRLLTLTGSDRLGETNSFVNGQLTFSGAGTMNNGDLIKNTDNDTLWALSDGPIVAAVAGNYDAQFTAVDPGPIEANAGTTWALVTVIPNLSGFANATDDAELGRLAESESDARQRRTIELRAQGQGPLATIRGAVSRVSGVLAVQAYHNPSQSPTDADGIPFKAFNVVVETTPATPSADTQQGIWDAIWSVLGAGGEAYGTDYVGTSTDSEGVAQPVAFDVIDVVNVKLEIALQTSTSEKAISENIEAVVKSAVLALAQGSHEIPGRDVLALDYQGEIDRLQREGIVSGVDAATVTITRLPTPPGPSSDVKIAIGIREKPDFDSANITVTQV